MVEVTGDNGEPQLTGFLATTPQEYADAITKVRRSRACMAPSLALGGRVGRASSPPRRKRLPAALTRRTWRRARRRRRAPALAMQLLSPNRYRRAMRPQVLLMDQRERLKIAAAAQKHAASFSGARA